MKKRKFIDFLTVAVVAAAVALSVGCAQDANKTSTDELPVIVIGSDEYEPYNFSDKNGEPAGIDVEIATEAFGRMGYKAKIQKYCMGREGQLSG